MSNRQLHKAFTLIEIMVVISIIGILTAIGVVSYINLQKGARDKRRKADLEQIRTVLEMYKADHGFYPGPYGSVVGEPEENNNCQGATGVCDIVFSATDDLTTNLLIPQGYLKSAVIDPQQADTPDSTPCDTATQYRYNYRPSSSASTCSACDNYTATKCTHYYLTAIMEESVSKDESPCSSTMVSSCCGTLNTSEFCYAKFNP